MQFESLIFDIDGTLWDNRSVVAEGYNAQLKDEGMEPLSVNEDILSTVFGRVLRDIADILFVSVPETKRYALLDRCIAREDELLRSSDKLVSYPNVKETLEELKKNHRLFIVSNSQVGYPELSMEKMKLTHLFSGHLCFGDTHTCKGETIIRLMKEHNITSACYIGDTLGDQEAAELAGIPFIHCTFGFGTSTNCFKAINSFSELLEI